MRQSKIYTRYSPTKCKKIKKHKTIEKTRLGLILLVSNWQTNSSFSFRLKIPSTIHKKEIGHRP